LEIHKPKPVRTWREFLSEIGGVVIGIVIALGGEQLIELIHRQHRITETEHEVPREMSGNIAQAITRLRLMTCFERRVGEISGLVDGAVKTGKLPPLGNLGRPPAYLWTHGAWDGAVAAQITSHIDTLRLSHLTGAYQFVNRLENVNQREQEAWPELFMIVGPGRTFDGASETAARLAISHVRFMGREMGLMSLRLLQNAKPLKLQIDKTGTEEIAKATHDQLDSTLCQPIGTTVTPTYGQVQWDDVGPLLQKAIADIEYLY
jgi:hypothetical protein